MLDDLDARMIHRIVDGKGGLSPSMFPNLSALARRGVVGRNAFANAVSCCPSRATFLVGTYISQNKIWSNGFNQYFAPDPGADPPPKGGGYPEFRRRGLEREAISAALQPFYRTILAGKYFNGYRPSEMAPYVGPKQCANGRPFLGKPDGWDAAFAFMGGKGYRSNGYSDFVVNRNGCLVERSGGSPHFALERMRAFVAGEVDRARSKGQPFFVYFAAANPHSITPVDGVDQTDKWVDPALARPFQRVRYYDRCGPTAGFDDPDDLFDGTPEDCTDFYSFNERNKTDGLSDKPEWVRQAQTSLSFRRIDTAFRNRLAAMKSFDITLGRMTSDLARRGELANTVIIVTSDQGFKLAEHGIRFGKNTPYDEDVRIPFLAAGPGIVRDLSFEPMIGMVDIHATIREMTGLAPRGPGRSFLAELRGEGGSGRDYIFAEGVRGGYRDAPDLGVPMNQFSVIRGRDFKFVWTIKLDETGAPVDGSDWYELYDLEEDPQEMRAAQPDSLSLRMLRAAVRACQQGSCPPVLPPKGGS